MPGFSDGFGIGHGLSSLVWIIAIIVIGVIVWRGRADAISDRGIKFRVPGVTHDNAHCSEIWDFLVDRISDQAKIVSWKIQVNGCGGGTFQAEDPKIEAYTLARFGLSAPVPQPGPPTTSATPAAPVGAAPLAARNPVSDHYVNDQNVSEYLDLGSDGKFFWRVGGRDFTGSYQISEGILTLRFPP